MIQEAILLQQMRRRARAPVKKLREYQDRKLREIIRHSYDNVPFYRELFDANGIRPQDIRGTKDLGKIPILPKEVIQQRGDDFISRTADTAACRKKTTTGTTGLVLNLFSDATAEAYNNAVNFRSLFENGYRLTDRILEFTAEKNIPKEKSAPERMGLLQKERISFLEEPGVLIEKMNEYKPDIIMGPPPKLLIIAEEIERRGALAHQPRLIFTSTSMLVPNWRETIQRAFGADIRDTYGSTEFRRLAWECEKHEGYHMDVDFAIIEIVPDSTDDPDVGTVVVTGLHNKAMPLIRYRLGDIARRSGKSCSCGRTLPLMEGIEGRFNDIAHLPSGRRLIVSNFNQFMEFPYVKQYQIVQEDADRMRINIVPARAISAKERSELDAALRASCYGEKMRYEIRIVDTLPLDKSGKFRALISKVRK